MESSIDEDIEKVSNDPSRLNMVVHRKNPLVIMAALKKDLSMMMHVDDKDINLDIATYVIQQDGKMLMFIPYKLKTKELCDLAFKQNPESIEFIPYEFIDEDMAFHAVEHDWKLLAYVPNKLKNIKDLSLFAFKKNPESIEVIPHEFIDEDMAFHAVEHDWKLLAYVPNDLENIKDLSSLAFEKDYKSLSIIPPELITQDMAYKAIFHDVSLFMDVPAVLKNKELCLYAVQKNPKLIGFVPIHIRLETDILFESLSRDGNMIVDMPSSFLNKELIERLLELNPNIIYIYGILDKIKDFIPEYEDVPLPPELTRKLSFTSTNQGTEGVCGRHAFSRVIIKNVFELLYPLVISTTYQKNNCNLFLKTDDIVLNPSYIHSLTPEMCSQGGYLKILLFLHLFHLFQTHIPTVEGKPKGWLDCIQVSDLYSFLYQEVTIPYINRQQTMDLTKTLKNIKQISDDRQISLVTFHFKEITFPDIKKITDHGLYIMLRIEDSISEGEHKAHFVIIVGTIDDFLLIKNSWGEQMIYKIKFDTPFYIHTYRFDIKTDCSFVIPVEMSTQNTFNDLTRVDEFLTKYDALKISLQGVLSTTTYTPYPSHNTFEYDPSKPCPSRDTLPIACENDSHYRRQAKLFHPDRNPGCVGEATQKFTKLKTLKGCNRDHRVPRLLLTAGTRKKRKTKRKYGWSKKY